jgi:hypothetical protein
MRCNRRVFEQGVLWAAASLIFGTQGCTLMTSLDALSSGLPPPPDEGGGGEPGDRGGDHLLPFGGAGGGGGAAGGGGLEPLCPEGPVVVDAYAGLRLNEIAPNGSPDWVEVVNIGAAPVELCGCSIAQGSDGAALPADPEDVHVLGAGVVQPGAVYVLPTLSFGIAKSEPESLALFDPLGAPVDHTSYVATPDDPNEWDEVWARFPDGVGAFARAKGPTMGMHNQ